MRQDSFYALYSYLSKVILSKILQVARWMIAISALFFMGMGKPARNSSKGK